MILPTYTGTTRRSRSHDPVLERCGATTYTVYTSGTACPSWPHEAETHSDLTDSDEEDTEEDTEDDSETEAVQVSNAHELFPGLIPASFLDIDSDTSDSDARDAMSQTDQETESIYQAADEETPLKQHFGSQGRNQASETPIKQIHSAENKDQVLENTSTSVLHPHIPVTDSCESQDGSVACDCGSHMAGDTEGENSHHSTSANTASVNITEESSATDDIDITEEFEYELSLHEDLPGVGAIGNLRMRNSGNAAPQNQYESESSSLHISSSSGSHFSVPSLARHTFSATNPSGHSTSVPSSAGVRLSMESGEESLPAEQHGMEVQPLNLPDDTECRLVHRRGYT